MLKHVVTLLLCYCLLFTKFTQINYCYEITEKMDNLAYVDPNILQLAQLLEEDEGVVPILESTDVIPTDIEGSQYHVVIPQRSSNPSASGNAIPSISTFHINNFTEASPSLPPIILQSGTEEEDVTAEAPATSKVKRISRSPSPSVAPKVDGISAAKKPRLAPEISSDEEEGLEDLEPTSCFTSTLEEANERINAYKSQFGVEYAKRKNPKEFGKTGEIDYPYLAHLLIIS